MRFTDGLTPAIAEPMGLALIFTVAEACRQASLVEKQLKKQQGCGNPFSRQSKLGGNHPKLWPAGQGANQAPGTWIRNDGTAGRACQKAVRCFKCIELCHYSLDVANIKAL